MKQEYEDIVMQARSLLQNEKHAIANAANLAALLYHTLDDVNWVGFYLREGEELVVGPFQGQPACVRIAFGQGVCGTSAARRELLNVPSVNAFPGHIPCDARSHSELVMPLIDRYGELHGVLDVDSPSENRFAAEEEELLAKLAEIWVDSLA